MIEIQNLTKRFDKTTAVDGLSFTVEDGQTLALIGSSGSGKTTTLRMINRLIEPDEGRIIVNGEDVTQQPLEVMRRRMGYVIQHTGLFPHYTVTENIAVVPTLLRWKKDRIQARVHTLLAHVGLPPATFADKYPDQLSGGQQQRVGLARALAADPPIVLMDEPFGALDPVTRLRIRREVLQLEAFAGKTIVLVTHDVEEAFEMADQICLLDAGSIQQIGTPQELLQQPANDFVASFFAGQQWHLEWTIYTLADLWPQLSNTLPKPAAEVLSLPPDTTISAALGALRASGQRAGATVQQEQKRYFDIATLVRAWEQSTGNGMNRGMG